MKYEKITINNFRSIKYLEIDDLKRINVIVGRNNCGKTSILESIFLLSGMSNPQLPVNIHRFRNLSLVDDEELSFMFRNLDFNNIIELKGFFEKGNRKLKIVPEYFSKKLNKTLESENSITQNKNISSSTNIKQRNIDGIKLVFEIDNKKYESELRLREKLIKIPDNYFESLSCTYLTPKTLMLDLSYKIEKLLINKKLKDVIDILKMIDKNITDIDLGYANNILVDIGLDKLIYLNIIGDGLIKILSIIITIMTTENGIVLIDEIENGLHYTSLDVLWKAINEACIKYNVQLIATTHSYECINSLSKVFENVNEDEVRLYRIDYNIKNKEHLAYKLDKNSLELSVDKNYEIR